MLDLCDDLQRGLGDIDYGLLGHGENPDDEFLGDQEPSSALVGKSIPRGRMKIGVRDFPDMRSTGADDKGDDTDGGSGLSDSDEDDDTLDPDTGLVVMDDAAAEAKVVVDGGDLPDHFKRMVTTIREDILLPAESRPRVPMSRGVRYRRYAASRS